MKRLPAEWEPQSGIMLTWPHQYSDWRPILAQVEHVFIDIATQTSRFEKVLITCYDDAHQQHIASLLKTSACQLEMIHYCIAESNDTWARDHGPITIIENDQPVLLDFSFNGWGDKYESTKDNQLTRQLHQQCCFGDTAIRTIDFVLEGGSIDSNGQGILLTTAQCLLTPTRNPDYNKTRIEQQLQQDLGIKKILWLSRGELEGDDTDSHIDTLARFTDAHTIVYTKCDDTSDSQNPSLLAMESELKAFTHDEMLDLRLMALPLPDARFNALGDRLPATYANFLILNHAVLVPVYNAPQDETALSILSECFPDRDIIPIDCSALIHQYGSLHCVTMQLPHGVL